MTPSRRSILRGFLALPVVARFAPVAAVVPHWATSTTVWSMSETIRPPELVLHLRYAERVRSPELAAHRNKLLR